MSVALGRKLETCTRKDPCGSSACPVCSREHRIWSLDQVHRLIRGASDPKVVTLIPNQAAVSDREYFNLDVNKLKGRIRRQFERSGFSSPVVGYWEVDFSDESDLWIIHVHLLVLSGEQPFDGLRNRFYSDNEGLPGKENVVNRPMVVQPLNDFARQVSYQNKSYNSRILSFEVDGERRRRKVRLSESRLRLDLRVSDRVGFDGLRFMYRCRRKGRRIVKRVN